MQLLRVGCSILGDLSEKQFVVSHTLSIESPSFVSGSVLVGSSCFVSTSLVAGSTCEHIIEAKYMTIYPDAKVVCSGLYCQEPLQNEGLLEQVCDRDNSYVFTHDLDLKMLKASTEMAEMPETTSQIIDEQKRTILIHGNEDNIQVAHLQNTFLDSAVITLDMQAEYLIVNVSGERILWKNVNITENGFTKVIINFFEASEIFLIQDSDLVASVIAPKATMHSDILYLNGQLLVKNFSGSLQIQEETYFNCCNDAAIDTECALKYKSSSGSFEFSEKDSKTISAVYNVKEFTAEIERGTNIHGTITLTGIFEEKTRLLESSLQATTISFKIIYKHHTRTVNDEYPMLFRIERADWIFFEFMEGHFVADGAYKLIPGEKQLMQMGTLDEGYGIILMVNVLKTDGVLVKGKLKVNLDSFCEPKHFLNDTYNTFFTPRYSKGPIKHSEMKAKGTINGLSESIAHVQSVIEAPEGKLFLDLWLELDKALNGKYFYNLVKGTLDDPQHGTFYTVFAEDYVQIDNSALYFVGLYGQIEQTKKVEFDIKLY